MAASKTSQPQELPSEAIDLLLEKIPPARLLSWLGEQSFGQGVLRGFQQTSKSLRLTPVRNRFKEALHHHVEAAHELSAEWQANHQELTDKIASYNDKKLLQELAGLHEKYDSKTVQLALMLADRAKVLQQEENPPKSKKSTTKTTSKKKISAKTADLEQAIIALQQEIEQHKNALENSAEKLHQTQQKFKEEITRAHEKQQQTLSRERELAHDLKLETARAEKAEQELEEKTRHLHRNERRLKKLQQEHEAADLEMKRLRRQVRQQQQIAEDLRKQLAGLQPQIDKETKVLSSGITPQATKKTETPKRKTLLNPADQQFLFEVAGKHFQISARQLAQAVERNDEDLVFSLAQALFTLREMNPEGHKMFLERVRAFDRYSARVLTGDTTRVLVDASNVARFEKNKYGKGILENLLALRDELRSRSYFPIVLIADASLPHFIDQPQELKKLVLQNIIQITNKGEEADEYLTRLAQQTGAFVVTNDVNFHLKTAPDFDPLRIGFTVDHGAVYLHEF